MRAKHAKAIEAFARDAESALAEHPSALLELMGAQFLPDEFEFELVLCNDGELTLRGPVVDISRNYSSDSLGNLSFRTPVVSRHEMSDDVIYPGDERLIPNSKSLFRRSRGHASDWHKGVCEWNVFLDDSQPSKGKFSIADVIQTAWERAGGRPGA